MAKKRRRKKYKTGEKIWALVAISIQASMGIAYALFYISHS